VHNAERWHGAMKSTFLDRLRSCSLLWCVGLLALLCPEFAWRDGTAQAQTQPQVPRVGPNLITNPNFNGTSGWLLAASQYDAAQSRTADGTGSMRIPWGTRLDIAANIPVTAGKTYIFSAYIKVTTWPPPLVDLGVGLYNAAGTNVVNDESGMAGNSTPNTWEELSMVVTPTAGVTSVTFVFYRGYADSGGAPNNMWVDEVYFGEGVGFASPPTPKIPFDGANIKADALGNITVLRGSTFQPFFPLCMYSDGRRANYGYPLYSAQGFNCDMWGNYQTLPNGAAATSSFNPNGLMVSMQMVQYTNSLPGGAYDADGSRLRAQIQALKDSGYFASHFLFYYWDNENVWDHWNEHMTTIANTQDADKVGGVRTHPLYMLQGSYGAARTYHTATGVGVRGGPDITGVYSGSANTGGAGHAGSQEIIWNQQGQNVPVVVEQMNIATAGAPPGEARRLWYAHIGRGAKAIGIWRDCAINDCGGVAVDITTVPWWPDVPNLRTEIDQLLPIIRQPHWTSWTASYNQSLAVTVGTRDYLGKGHLWLNNESHSSATTVTFTLAGLPYTPTSAVNVLTGASTPVTGGNTLTVTLPALGINSGTAVLRLEGSVDPAAPVVTITAPTSATTYPTETTPLTTLAGTATDTTGVPVGGLSVSCVPSCGTPTVTCPTCGPAATSVSWSVASVPLLVNGTTTITVTATDATAKTGSDTLQVTHTEPPEPPSLVLHWPLNEGSGTTTADTSGGSYTGTLVGGPTWGPGCQGSALTFNGTSQYVTNTSLAWPAAQPVSVVLWVKIAGSTANGTFNVGGATTRLAGHITWSDNILYWDVYDAGAGRLSTPFSAYLNQWTHVALVNNGSNFRAIYINGALAASNTVGAPTNPALTGVELGRYTVGGLATYYHTGQLDDFRIYKGVLSAADISALYTASSSCPGIPPSAPPTVAITAPTSAPLLTTSVTPLTTVAGTASDDVLVSSVTWTCPTCTPASGTATGTTSWSIASLGLASGDNVLTVTATDSHSQPAQDTLTITLTGVEDITSNLALYWDMNEASGASLLPGLSSTVTGTLGTSTAAPTRLSGAQCKFGGCLQFDEVNDLINFSYATGTTYTIAMWVWNDSTATQTWGTLFAELGGFEGLFLSQAGANDNKLDLYFAATDHFSTGTVPVDTWAHLAVVVTPSGSTFYVNGANIGTTAAAPAIDAILVGAHDTTLDPFKGRLDELRVYSRALTPAQVSALAAWQPAGAASAPPTLTLLTPPETAGVTVFAVHGVASDDTGVVSIAVACEPSCGAPVVTCTPTCGAGVSPVTWNALVPVQVGANTITVTANDSVPQSVSQQVTITVHAPTVTNRTPPRGRMP
jgi:Concanavalin A-like lectin/glucanases superfamily/Carbohydrate binding domain